MSEKRNSTTRISNISNLSDDILELITDKNENPNLAAVSKAYKKGLHTDMKNTKEFSTCVKNISENNELQCLERARSVKYPLKCVDFCKLRTGSEQYCDWIFCSDISLKFDYPIQMSLDMKLYMLLFAQGNRQMRLTMNRHPPLLSSSDQYFFKFLKDTTSYNPLACVEFPCYLTEHFSMGGSGYEHQFQSANVILQDLNFLIANSIHFKSVMIYHYPGVYNPLVTNDRVNFLNLNENEIKTSISPELLEYMESLFPNTLQTFLAAEVDGKRTCGKFAGPCILLIFGDITGYSYAEYIHTKATQSQNEYIARINEKIQQQRRQNTHTFEFGLTHLRDDKNYTFYENNKLINQTGAKLKARIRNAQKNIDSDEAKILESKISYIFL